MKRILTVQDISCVGKCSLTVALPVISASGVECSVLPTAVLSTHTAFPEFTFRDLTDEIEPIGEVFSRLGIDFDAVYTGYLGSKRQVALVSELIRRQKERGAYILIDPAMADNGSLYPGFTAEFPPLMADMCRMADLVVPNVTEAALMLGMPYREKYDEKYIKELLSGLVSLGARSAAISGVSFSDDKIGFMHLDGESGEYTLYLNEKLPKSYHGTGDLFASVALGGVMRSLGEVRALELATDVTLDAMKHTARDKSARFYGVNFEEALPLLISRLSE